MKRTLLPIALGAALAFGAPAHADNAISFVKILTCDEGGSEQCWCHYMYEPVRGHVCTP